MMFNKYYVLLAIIAQNAHCATENSTTGNQYCSKEDMACCGEKEVETEATPSIGNACKKYEEYPVRVVSKECYSNLNVLQQIVALIMGIMGDCRAAELHSMQITDLDHGTISMVSVPNTKTKISRKFTVMGNFYAIVRKYLNLRPTDLSQTVLFFRFQNGKYHSQRIGINKFVAMGKDIATFLKLPDNNLYTGHCFRRSSATLLVDAGGDITALKRHGGWRSTTVAEGYIDDSERNKTDTANKIYSSITPQPRNLLKSARLRVQVYGVTTVDDGFVNMLYVANSSEKRLEQSVLLEAGFLIRGEAFGDKYGRSLAIYLANKGYEVWIGFLRGATVGFDRRGSIVKNEFGYDLDLVAGDDFNHKLYNIKNSRGNKPKLGKVVYIGHSFAATYGLMYASQKPDDAKKLIKAIISLAPVTTMANSKLKDFVVNKFPILADIYKTINISDSKTAPLRLLFVNYCMEKPIFCKDLIERVFGKSDQMLPEEMTLFLGNFPGKFTYKMLEQIAQIVKAGEVQKYKSTDKYDFSSVTLPVYTFYGETDAISTKEDVEALVKSLGSKKKPIQVVNKGNSFNHLDFLYAKDIEELLYKPILKILEEVKDL